MAEEPAQLATQDWRLLLCKGTFQKTVAPRPAEVYLAILDCATICPATHCYCELIARKHISSVLRRIVPPRPNNSRSVGVKLNSSSFEGINVRGDTTDNCDLTLIRPHPQMGRIRV